MSHSSAELLDEKLQLSWREGSHCAQLRRFAGDLSKAKYRENQCYGKMGKVFGRQK